jgi:hypothetical protein
VAFHQDALGALDERAAAERAFEVVVLGEAPQDGARIRRDLAPSTAAGSESLTRRWRS